MSGQGRRLYWSIQWRRNEGMGALFLVLLYFARPVMEADAEGTVAPAE